MGVQGHWYQIILVFILLQSSLIKSPLHILFSIWPYSGSSLKRCLFSKMITALRQFSQCCFYLRTEVQCLWHQLVQVDGSPRQILWWIHQKIDSDSQYPWVSCQVFWRMVSLMNDTLSITTICASCHSFLSSTLSCLCWLRNAAMDIVTPPNSDAANPVYTVKMNVLSLHRHYTHCYTKFVAKLLCNFPGSAAFPWTSRPGKNHQELVPSTSCL